VSTGHRLFTTSALAFVFRLLGAAIMLGVQVVIARKLGGNQLGLYAVLLSVCNIIAVVLPTGFQTIASYFAASYAGAERGTALRHFIAQAFAQTLLSALVTFLLGAQIIAMTGHGTLQVTDNWHVIVAAATGLALMQLSSSILVSLKKALFGLAGDAVVRPVVTALAFCFALQMALNGNTITLLFKLLAVAFIGLGMIYGMFAVRAVSAVPAKTEPMSPERRQWWFYAVPWTVLALAGDYFFDIDLLMLTAYLNLTELAIFGIAARLVSLAAFGINAIYAVSLPDFFSARAKGEEVLFAQQLQRTNRVAVMMSCVMLVGATFVAPPVLALLGTEFGNAATPFAVLCLCPMIRAVFGPTALMLSMRQQPYKPLPAVAFGFACLFVCNAWLVPLYHLNGAAISAVLATFIWSASLWLVTWREIGVDVSIFSGVFSTNQIAPPRL
jgi:O-antigen/teichoic acid export membrane protein